MAFRADRNEPERYHESRFLGRLDGACCASFPSQITNIPIMIKIEVPPEMRK